MADYDLGTAHGRIVVDYKDNGTGKAQKDLDGLRAKAKQLMDQFQETASKYASNARKMATEGASLFGRLRAGQQNLSSSTSQLIDDFDRFTNQITVFTGALALALPLLSKTASATNGLKGGIAILGQLRGALGRTPSGAEGFPSAVKKIMQLSAAIGLFASTTSLLAAVTNRFKGVSAVTGLLARFGGAVNGLAGPLHAVAGIAGSVAFQILQFRFIKAVIKPLLMFGGALGAVGGALHLVAGLAVSIKDLSGVLGLLPAIAGAAAFGFAALKIATLGLSDAFKAWNDPAKFAEALKKLHPEAAKTVLAIKSLEGAFKEAQKRIQGRLFDGLAKPIQELGQKYIPILEERFGRVVDAVNTAGHSVLNFLNSMAGVKQAKTIMTDYANIWENLTPVIEPLVQVLFDILDVSGKVFKDLTKGAGDAAKRFAEFIDKARESGDLERWIRSGVQAMKDLWGIVSNVGKALGGIWKGLNGGEAKSFLGTLNELTAKFNAFIQSAEGQRVLGLLGDQFNKLWTEAQKLGQAFVTYVLPALEKFLPIMSQLSSGVIDGIITALKILSPIFIALGTALGPIAPLLGYILSGMVAFTVVLLGLGVAAKVVGSAIFILKSGMDTVKTVMGVAGFAARLMTGNLKKGELQALKLAGTLVKRLIPALLSTRVAMLALKWLAIAAAIDVAIGALKGYSDEQNKTFANQGFMDDLKTFWDEFKNEPFQAVGKEFRASLTPPPSAASDFKRIGDSFQHDFLDVFAGAGKRIGESFNKDFIGFFQGLPAKIGGWLSGVGESFMTNLGTPVMGVVTRIKESFMTDFVGFFTSLPEKISGLGTTISTSVSTAFQGMRTAAQQKFNELAGDAQGLPERIAHVIGALVGMALTWGRDTWENFKLGCHQKWDEIVVDAQALPGRIGAALTSLYEAAKNWAITTWQGFKDSANAKMNEAQADAQSLPDRIGAAISALKDRLVQRAQEAWDNFKREAKAKIDQAEADARALPGKVAGAISSLAGQLRQKAVEAWEGFKASANAKIQSVLADARAFPGRVVSAVGNLGSTLYNAGVSLIDGFKRGIDAAKERVLASIRAFMDGVRQYFPFSPAKKGPFAGRGYTTFSGKALVADFAKGMLANKNMIQSAANAAMSAANLSGSVNLSGTTGNLASGAAAPIFRGSASGGDGASAAVTNNYHVTIDAKTVAEMNSVTNFFNSVQQKARAGKAGR